MLGIKDTGCCEALGGSSMLHCALQNIDEQDYVEKLGHNTVP